MKKLVSATMALLMITAFSTSLSAVDIQQELDRNATYVTINTTEFVLCPAAIEIPQTALEALSRENPNTTVTVYEYGLADEPQSIADPIGEIAPRGVLYGPVNTTYSNVKKEVQLSDEFVISVAAGKTDTLTTVRTVSYTGTVTGTFFEVLNIGAERTLSTTYTTTVQFQGPPIGSGYNSMQYRVRFMGETGNYTQTRKKTYLTVGGTITSEETETKVGSYKKPEYYLSYSVPMKVV